MLFQNISRNPIILQILISVTSRFRTLPDLGLTQLAIIRDINSIDARLVNILGQVKGKVSRKCDVISKPQNVCLTTEAKQ